MTLVATTVVVLLFVAGGFGLAAAVTTFEIVDAINLKLPEAGRLESIGSHPAKTLRVIRQYKELYPQGAMARRLGIYVSFGFASVLAAGIVIGFPPLLVVFLAAGAVVLLLYSFFHERATP